MSSITFPELYDDETGLTQSEVEVLDAYPSGLVQILINTSDGWHGLIAEPARWRAIIREIERRLPVSSPEDAEALRMGGDR